MGKIIGVLSGKGGVGKTTVVANLGAALTKEFNKNVIIFDSNITTSHLGLHLGLYEDLPVTLKDVLSKKIPISYAIFVHPTTGIRILPAPLSGDGKISNLKDTAEQLKKDYEIIIMDCAPGLGEEVVAAIECVDQGIIVTTPDLPSVTDAFKTIDLLKRLEKEVLGIVVNRVKNKKFDLTSNEIRSMCNCNVISTIPEDSKIPESISKGIPIVLYKPNSPASIELKKLAGHLIGKTYTSKRFLHFLKKLFGTKKEKIEPVKKITEEKKISPEKPTSLEEIIEESLDMEKLKKELSEEVKNELKQSIKEDIKKEIMKRLKEKLRRELK